MRRGTGVVVTILGVLLAGAPTRAVGQERYPAAAAASVRPSPSAGEISVLAAASPKKPLRATDRESLEAQWGIQIESLRLTAGGYMLDFRYRVVNAEKAAPLFERKTKPVLKDEASGAVLMVPTPPKIGALRSSNDPKEGRTYFAFFGNPGRFLARNRKVTITIGEFSVSGLTVR